MRFHLFFILLCVTIKFVLANRNPVVIAHRGASGYLPEHTLEAKSMAYTMGSDYVEQDLVLSKDNVPIVLHDIYLDEVTDVANRSNFAARKRANGRFYAIDFTFEEIKSLRVTERYASHTNLVQRFPNRFPLWKSSFQLNSLKEEIELVQGLQKSTKQSAELNEQVIGIYPEIKDPYFHAKEGKKDFSEIVLQILKDYNYTKKSDPCILQCFDPFELKRIRSELKSELKLVQLLDTVSDDPRVNYTFWLSDDGLKNISAFADGLGPNKDLLIVTDKTSKDFLKPSNFLRTAKKLGLFLHPYTFRADALPSYVSSHNQLMKIFVVDAKIDGLFTDFPDLAIKYIEAQKSGINSNFKINTISTLLFSLIAILNFIM